MRLLPQKSAPSPADSIARQLTSLQHEHREAGASTLAQLSPEDAVRILSEALEKAYRRANRRADFVIALAILGMLGMALVYLLGEWSRLAAKVIVGTMGVWGFVILAFGHRKLTDSELELIRRLIEHTERATLPSAAGAILDVLKWPLKYPADRDALLTQLARLLALADDDTARALTPAQLKTLAELIYSLDNPELTVAGLLTLTSATHVDETLLTELATREDEETAAGMAAWEYRRMARGVVG